MPTALLTTLLLLAACTPAPVAVPVPTPIPSPTPKTGRGAGDTLHMLYWQAPTILNPHLATSLKDWDVSRITLEPLASFDKEGTLVPFLAAEIPTLENGEVAADGKSVTWKLKSGILWSDGQPFSASDVKFTYDFITNPNVAATSTSLYRTVESVQVIDANTIKINFKDVNPAWALPFVGAQGAILPEHLFKDYNGKNATDAPANKLAVGTGPYRVVSFKPQEVLFLGTQLIETNKITFEPNPYFREADKPYFSRIEVRGGGTVDEAGRLVFADGVVDYAWNLQLDATALDQLVAEGKGVLLLNPGARTERVLLNRTDPNKETPDGERSSVLNPHPFFSDLKVRQAFAYAVDRKSVAALYGTAGIATGNNLVAPLIYNSPNTTWEYNLDKARQLLDEAGWRDTNGDGVRDKDGVKLKVVFQTSVNSVRQATQTIIKNSLEQIGVEVELKVVDASVFFSSEPNPDQANLFYTDMEMYRDGNRNPDPGSYMLYWTCGQIAQKSNKWQGTNVERWCNPEYDALYQQSTKELDPNKRAQLFIQMNDMLVNDVVMIPLALRAEVSGAGKSMQGIVLTPWDSETWLIKDWKRATP
jgi:peptide/nickel transport system substrate-binding protein